MEYVIIIVCIQTAKNKNISFQYGDFFSIAIRYCQLDFSRSHHSKAAMLMESTPPPRLSLDLPKTSGCQDDYQYDKASMGLEYLPTFTINKNQPIYQM